MPGSAMYDILVKEWAGESWLRSDSVNSEGAVTRDKTIRVLWCNRTGSCRVICANLIGTGRTLDEARRNWMHNLEKADFFQHRIDFTKVSQTIHGGPASRIIPDSILEMENNPEVDHSKVTVVTKYKK
jgi:hypothetical protein